MKLMAIRLIESKEPVMLLGGHKKQWRDVDLFWALDECTDPSMCEYLDINLPKYSFCIHWPQQLEKYDDSDQFNIQDNMEFGEDAQVALDRIFASEHGWNSLEDISSLDV